MNGPHLRFREFLSSHTEWIAVFEDGRVFALRSHEMELTEGRRGPLFGFLDRGGYRACAVESIELENGRASVLLRSRFGIDSFRLELIPRTSPAELGENIEIARLEAANRLADEVIEAFPGSKLKRVFLNHANGRTAQMILDGGPFGERGIIGDISGSVSPERLVSAAVLWADRAHSARRSRLKKVFVLACRGRLASVRRLHACLSPAFSATIGILSLKTSKGGDRETGSGPAVKEVSPLTIDELWKTKASKIIPFPESFPGRLAESVEALDPSRIDRLYARNGVTLRYLGLPFARCRTVKGGERGWYGVEASKILLREDTAEELAELVDKLAEYRRHDSPNKQHLYYQSRHEAWLESILRRNIRKLDPGLVLSPLYNQFRSSRDRIDLLALRRDGRLAIIELKVAPDNGMVFQAVDYWRRIELQRRGGVLAAAKLFGDRKISDSPALVYLGAPATCFTRQTDILLSSVSPGIRVVRFHLNEDWKRELKVLKVEG